MDNPSSTDDPYEAFLAEQRTREVEWAANRAAKRVKIGSTANKSSDSHVDETDSIQQQLDAKTEECVPLKNQLWDLQKANADAVKSQHALQENLRKVSVIIVIGSSMKILI